MLKIGDKITLKNHDNFISDVRPTRSGIVERIYKNYVLIKFDRGYRECISLYDLKYLIIIEEKIA